MKQSESARAGMPSLFPAATCLCPQTLRKFAHSEDEAGLPPVHGDDASSSDDEGHGERNGTQRGSSRSSSHGRVLLIIAHRCERARTCMQRLTVDGGAGWGPEQIS